MIILPPALGAKVRLKSWATGLSSEPILLGFAQVKAIQVPVDTAPLLHPEKVQENGLLLMAMAQKYIWWLTPDEAMNFPARIVTQVMNIGEFEDMQGVAEALGDDGLRAVLRGTEAGQLNERSWHYWHYRLGLAAPGGVPPLPVRRIE